MAQETCEGSATRDCVATQRGCRRGAGDGAHGCAMRPYPYPGLGKSIDFFFPTFGVDGSLPFLRVGCELRQSSTQDKENDY